MVVFVCEVFLKILFILREREREESMCASRGGTERKGERILSRLCVVSTEPDAGLSLMTVRS